MKKTLLFSVIIASALSASGHWYENPDGFTDDELWQEIQRENNQSETNTTAQASIILNNVQKAQTTAARDSLKKFNTIIKTLPESERHGAFVKGILKKIRGVDANLGGEQYNTGPAISLDDLKALISAYDNDPSEANKQAIENANTSQITDMSYLFQNSSFNGNLNKWDVSNVTTLEGTFSGATSFNGDISKWNVSNVTTLKYTFANATSFNGDISKWNVSNVTDLWQTFFGASNFNSNLSSWDVSSVKYLIGTFFGATSFNSDLSSWNVSNVEYMIDVFYEASSFNSDLSGWNVSNVKSMSRMFNGASSFNSDLSGWNVSNVTDMYQMFYYATSFNSDLSGWNTASVKDMTETFRGASAFNSDLSGWNVSSVTRSSNFALNSGLSSDHIPNF